MPEAPSKKINADSFKKGLSLEEKVESNSKKITLIKNIINVRKQNVDLRLEEIEDDVDNTHNDLMDGLHSVIESLVGVKAILADQVKERIKQRNDARIENEKRKKKRREDELESKKGEGGKGLGVGKVTESVFSKLKKFLTSILLGGLLLRLLDWFKDPNNLESLRNFGKFLDQHGGKIIATLAALAAVNFIGGLLNIGAALKGILGFVGIKAFAIAAAAAAAVTAVVGTGIEAKRYMDDYYGPNLMGRKSFNDYQQGMINRITKDGKEKALADEKAKLAKYMYERQNKNTKFLGMEFDGKKAEMERAIRDTERGIYDAYDPANMDPKDLAILEQVEPQFESARESWKKFRSIAVEIDDKVKNDGVDPEGSVIEELKKEQQIPKEALVKSLNNLIEIRKSLSNDGKNWFDLAVENGLPKRFVSGDLFTKRWEKGIKLGGLSQQDKGIFLDTLLKSGAGSPQWSFEWVISRAKEEGVKSNLKVNEQGETLESEKQKLLPPTTTDIVNESVVKDGREETIAKLREQKKNLNLWERLSGVGGEINEEIYRLETGKEMDQTWKGSYERKVNEGKVGNVLGGFEDRGPKVEPTTKLIDSKSYSTNKKVSGRFDMKTGKAYINNQEVSTDEYVKFQNLSKQEQIRQYGIDQNNNTKIDKNIIDTSNIKSSTKNIDTSNIESSSTNNLNIDKSKTSSIRSSDGINSKVVSNKNPKVNLMPLGGKDNTIPSSASGPSGNDSVLFSSEDPLGTGVQLAVAGMYNVSPV